jgi:hypothetical protein
MKATSAARLVASILAAWIGAAVPAVADPALQGATASDPLATRVTVDYRRAPVLDVLTGLAAAGRLTLESEWKSGGLITLALESVSLRTALTVFCESAGCQWTYDAAAGARLKVRAASQAARAPSLSTTSLSISLWETPAQDVLRALGRVLDLRVVIDPELPNAPVSVDFKEAAATSVLNVLAEFMRCRWELRADTGELHFARSPRK